MHLAGDVVALRPHGWGETWDFFSMLLTESKCVTNENLYTVMGPCLDRWLTGPPKAMQREVEDNVLLRFSMEVYETQLALGATSCTNTSGALPVGDHPRMKTLREHSYCGEISGDTRSTRKRDRAAQNRPSRYLSSAELFGVRWTVPRRPNPPYASSVIRCEALQHNVAQKKFPCVNNYSEAYIVAAPCVRWTHSKKDALLAISLSHSLYTNRRNTKSEHMCSEFTNVLFRTVFFVGCSGKTRF